MGLEIARVILQVIWAFLMTISAVIGSVAFTILFGMLLIATSLDSIQEVLKE